MAESASPGAISDGYHTFDELYEHRHRLFIALARAIAQFAPREVWRARKHHDGTMFKGGWFVAGIGREPGQQISYHLPSRLWDDLEFASTLEHAPEWDGHTPADVIERLKHL